MRKAMSLGKQQATLASLKGTEDEKILKLMRSFDGEMTTPKLLDTRLTPTGEAQAAALAASMRTSDARWLLDSLQMVVSSPLSRTLATASIAFGEWLGSGRGHHCGLPGGLRREGRLRVVGSAQHHSRRGGRRRRALRAARRGGRHDALRGGSVRDGWV